MIDDLSYARAAADYDNRLPDDACDDVDRGPTHGECRGCGRHMHLTDGELCARCEAGSDE